MVSAALYLSHIIHLFILPLLFFPAFLQQVEAQDQDVTWSMLIQHHQPIYQILIKLYIEMFLFRES